MEFGWINLYGSIIVILMLIPNIIYTLNNKNQENHCHNKIWCVIEQVGRYACIILMCLPILVWRFCFQGFLEILIYLFGNGLLLIIYYIFWILYFQKRTIVVTLVLGIVPICIFLMSGILLRHWLLIVFSVVFGISHIYISYVNCCRYN